MADKDSKFYELCFAKRGEIELYNCDKDPEQIHNLANNPEYKEVIEKLHAQLFTYLNETKDPRLTGEPFGFDTYSYREGEIKSSKKGKNKATLR